LCIAVARRWVEIVRTLERQTTSFVHLEGQQTPSSSPSDLGKWGRIIEGNWTLCALDAEAVERVWEPFRPSSDSTRPVPLTEGSPPGYARLSRSWSPEGVPLHRDNWAVTSFTGAERLRLFFVRRESLASTSSLVHLAVPPVRASRRGIRVQF
jgi:hypothetical protein